MDKTYDPSKAETRWYERWEERGLFQPAGSPGREPFVITLPPPNVTGILHIGHILGSSIQDLLIRYHRMKGRDTFWVAGTDHAGIATQKVVERGLEAEGRTREQLGREDFLREVWRWKERHHARITAQMRRMGYALDWTREAFTLDPARSRAVEEVFVRLHRRGLVYRSYYMVNWCPSCRTALSDEEVDMRELDAKLYHVRYPLVGDGGSLVVATTRPETMLGDVAVAVHPDDERAPALRGKKVTLPVAGRDIPVVEDAYVDPEFGSGFVKVTPAHDPNDYDIGRRHGLDPLEVMDEMGRMNERAGEFAGQDRFECRRNLLGRLEEGGYLDKVEPYRHNVGHHDRCDTVIEPRLSWQWFVRMGELARPAVEAVENGEITFFPERWKNVYLSWMSQIRDWCISRQLWWGHRIPVWYCAEQGCEATAVSTTKPAPGECGHGRWVQDEDVLDTWFSSWLWTFSTLGWPERTEELERYHPTSILVTGHDIIFFWVARMIMAGLEFVGEIPFHRVYLTGIVRDAQGRRMSKSLGNSPDPMDLADQYGADALRFTLTMLSPPGQDLSFAPENVEVGRNFANKLWNAARLVLGAEESKVDSGKTADAEEVRTPASEAWRLWRETYPDTDPGIDWNTLEPADRWILSRLVEAVEAVTGNVEGLRFNDAASALYDFAWHTYCDWYLELIKPRLRGGGAAEEARSVALLVLGNVVKMLHPVMPFLTEEIWSHLPNARGLLLESSFPEARGGLRDPGLEADFELLREIVTAVRNMRAEMGVPAGAKVALALSHPGEGDWSRRLAPLEEPVRLLARVESIRKGPGLPRPRQASAAHVHGLDLYLPLEGLIDLERERGRIEKTLGEVERELDRTARKLENEQFLSKAPAEVVDKEAQKRRALETKRERLASHLESLR
jgi:valyl-tRNA synthetase